METEEKFADLYIRLNRVDDGIKSLKHIETETSGRMNGLALHHNDLKKRVDAMEQLIADIGLATGFKGSDIDEKLLEQSKAGMEELLNIFKGTMGAIGDAAAAAPKLPPRPPRLFRAYNGPSFVWQHHPEDGGSFWRRVKMAWQHIVGDVGDDEERAEERHMMRRLLSRISIIAEHLSGEPSDD